MYSRPGCHLCHEMKSVIEGVLRQPGRADLALEEIDISTDPSLLARYEREIPVLTIDGKKAAKYRITEEDLIRKLAGRAGEAG